LATDKAIIRSDSAIFDVAVVISIVIAIADIQSTWSILQTGAGGWGSVSKSGKKIGNFGVLVCEINHSGSSRRPMVRLAQPRAAALIKGFSRDGINKEFGSFYPPSCFGSADK